MTNTVAPGSTRLVSDDPQVIIRKARKHWKCLCGWRQHIDPKPDGLLERQPHNCWLDIIPGDSYAEYYGESAAYQSGRRFCLDCAPVQLGDMVRLESA